MSQPRPLTQLAAQLYQLRHTGNIIPLVKVGVGDDSDPENWRPKPKLCHHNVDVWVWKCPEYEAIRGWVVFEDFATNPHFRRNPFVRFAAHSIIRAPDGKLLDITPNFMSQPYPFMIHPGTTEEFDQLRKDYDVMHIDHFLTRA
jgi:hypothetical protein